jgi:hypothetical protein
MNRSAPAPPITRPLILKRASASRPSGEWNNDDFDVLADGAVRLPHLEGPRCASLGTPWMWTLDFWHHEDHEDRTPTHGYQPTREAAMRHHDVMRLSPLTRSQRPCAEHRQRTGFDPERSFGRPQTDPKLPRRTSNADSPD